MTRTPTLIAGRPGRDGGRKRRELECGREAQGGQEEGITWSWQWRDADPERGHEQ